MLQSDFLKALTAVTRKGIRTGEAVDAGLYCNDEERAAMREEAETKWGTVVEGKPGKCVSLSEIMLDFFVKKWIMFECEFDDELCKLFDDNDGDGNGELDLDELRSMVTALGACHSIF